jgi:hypothetical protein
MPIAQRNEPKQNQLIVHLAAPRCGYRKRYPVKSEKVEGTLNTLSSTQHLHSERDDPEAVRLIGALILGQPAPGIPLFADASPFL